MGLSPYFSVKDLAEVMRVSPRTVTRLAKQLEVPPTVGTHACLRWNFEDARRLLDAWAGKKPKPYDTARF